MEKCQKIKGETEYYGNTNSKQTMENHLRYAPFLMDFN